MEMLEGITDDLNKLLKSEVLDVSKLEEICRLLHNLPHMRFKLLDFNYFDEKRLLAVQNEIEELARCTNLSGINYIENWEGNENFSKLSEKLSIKRKCEKHLRLKKIFKIEQSLFYSEDNTLVYFYIGTTPNDSAIYSYFTLPQTGFFTRPNVMSI